jgi:hypothetical protein
LPSWCSRDHSRRRPKLSHDSRRGVAASQRQRSSTTPPIGSRPHGLRAHEGADLSINATRVGLSQPRTDFRRGGDQSSWLAATVRGQAEPGRSQFEAMLVQDSPNGVGTAHGACLWRGCAEVTAVTHGVEHALSGVFAHRSGARLRPCSSGVWRPRSLMFLLFLTESSHANRSPGIDVAASSLRRDYRWHGHGVGPHRELELPGWEQGRRVGCAAP